MTETQWGGACYVLGAIIGLIWWRLRIEAELHERDTPSGEPGEEEEQDHDDTE